LPDAVLPELQRHVSDRAPARAHHRGRVRGYTRPAPRSVHRHEQRHEAPAAGYEPAAVSHMSGLRPRLAAQPDRAPQLVRLRAVWVLSIYSGQAQTINCTPATGSGTGCYALVVGDPYAGSHNVDQFYNPAAFANPNPVAAIGQTDFSPLGGKRSQVTGPPLRQ